MRSISLRCGAWIIGMLVLLLSGCSAVRLSYSQGPLLAYWWLDGYVDFTSEQSPRVKAALEDYFAWHRSAQLPDYVLLLERLQSLAQDRITPAQACRVADEVQRRIETAYERAVPQMAEIVRGLGPAQIDHLEKRYARNDQDTVRDYLQNDLAERRQASLKRTVEQAESLYGPLDESQRALVAAGLAASPFDPQRWLAERRARQQDIVRTLRQLLADRADAATVQAALRAFAAHTAHSPRADYRAYRQRLLDANCALAAQLHNSTRPAQRAYAQDKLKGWADDLRALMRAAQSSPPLITGP